MNNLNNKPMAAGQPIDRLIDRSKNSRRGFTLVEMLVVIGIIAILVGASMASFSKMMKTAEKARAQELLSNAVTALTAIYEADGMWPKKICEANASKDKGKLDKDIALILAKRGNMSLSLNKDKTELVGKDRFGILTPWAAKVIDRKGTSAALTDKVTADMTVEDNILNFAVDLDGDGMITTTECGGRTGVAGIRATAAVWCVSKDGKDQVQSWTKGQTQAVQ